MDRSAPAEALRLLAVSVLLGTAAQLASPTRIPWREDWSAHVQTKALKAGLTIADTDEARALLDSGAVLALDARSTEDYDADRLPGALSLPDAHRDAMYPLLAEMFSPSQRLLVYCSGLTCDESLQLSLYLREHGHTNLVLYVGGIKEWEAAGGPVER